MIIFTNTRRHENFHEPPRSPLTRPRTPADGWIISPFQVTKRPATTIRWEIKRRFAGCVAENAAPLPAHLDHFQRSTIDPGPCGVRGRPRDNYDKTGAGKAELIIQWRACGAHVNCVPQREMPRGGCPSMEERSFHFFRIDF